MIFLELQTKTCTGEDDEVYPLLYKCHTIILLNPLTIKSLGVTKGSYVLVHINAGQLILNCLPCSTIETTSAALYTNFFKYYVNSYIAVEPLPIAALPAKEFHLYPTKYKKFMSTLDFQKFIENELCYIYITHGMVVNIIYLGYSCSFTIKDIVSCSIKFLNKAEEVIYQLSRMTLDKEKKEKELHDSDTFVKDLKKSQTSTPVSSYKISSKLTPKKDIESAVTISCPQQFYFLSSSTKIILNTEESCRTLYFENIIGLDENVAYIKLAVNVLLYPNNNMQSILSKGILVIGPSGSGKSLISEALKTEFKSTVHFLRFQNSNSIANDMTEIRKIFECASESSNSTIIYLDDLDHVFLENKYLSTFKKNLTDLIYNTLLFCENILIIATVQNKSLLPAHLLSNGLFEKELTFTELSANKNKIILNTVCELLSVNDIDKVTAKINDMTGDELKHLSEEAKEIILQKYSITPAENFFTEYNIKKVLQKNKTSLPFNFEKPNVKWSDIGGMKKVKEAITEMVDWPLRLSHQFKRFQINPPRGILMYGPPGCCKTMIVKALVSESHLNFISIKGSELFNKYVGESERIAAELFKKARSAAPCVLFFDEIDSMTSTRGSTSGNSNVCDRVLTQLLIEMDGINTLEGVSILAATNRPDLIDPSFLRPGRFDRRIYVPLPDNDTRQEIFKVKLQKLPVSPDVSVSYLTQITEGYSGAEISEVCHEATKYAMLEDVSSLTTVITMKHFAKALQVVLSKTTDETKQFFENYEKRNAPT